MAEYDLFAAEYMEKYEDNNLIGSDGVNLLKRVFWDGLKTL